MNFVAVYFHNNTSAMLKFVDANWERVFNIIFTSEPDPGEIRGWAVLLIKSAK